MKKKTEMLRYDLTLKPNIDKQFVTGRIEGNVDEYISEV